MDKETACMCVLEKQQSEPKWCDTKLVNPNLIEGAKGFNKWKGLISIKEVKKVIRTLCRIFTVI